jgi:hypothetical protein
VKKVVRFFGVGIEKHLRQGEKISLSNVNHGKVLHLLEPPLLRPPCEKQLEKPNLLM